MSPAARVIAFVVGFRIGWWMWPLLVLLWPLVILYGLWQLLGFLSPPVRLVVFTSVIVVLIVVGHQFGR